MYRTLQLGLSAAFLVTSSGCWSSDTVIFELALSGTAGDADLAVPVSLEAYYQSIGEGILETDIFFIDAFEVVASQPFSHTLSYPLEGGRGLFLFAWADQDQDGALCAPGVDDEPVGGLRIDQPTEQPLNNLMLTLDRLCISPDQLAAELQP
ncbi:MAG: hypothetical protein CMP23_05760 [Rickettsiales bacterium]|nr:hypothetical protein [Rickettsiales bacterium]|tara:strand:+ start:183 stop:638 length:456 start_codon:yes stop_codon:yes gene_type:complete